MYLKELQSRGIKLDPALFQEEYSMGFVLACTKNVIGIGGIDVEAPRVVEIMTMLAKGGFAGWTRNKTGEVWQKFRRGELRGQQLKSQVV